MLWLILDWEDRKISLANQNEIINSCYTVLFWSGFLEMVILLCHFTLTRGQTKCGHDYMCRVEYGAAAWVVNNNKMNREVFINFTNCFVKSRSTNTSIRWHCNHWQILKTSVDSSFSKEPSLEWCATKNMHSNKILMTQKGKLILFSRAVSI